MHSMYGEAINRHGFDHLIQRLVDFAEIPIEAAITVRRILQDHEHDSGIGASGPTTSLNVFGSAPRITEENHIVETVDVHAVGNHRGRHGKIELFLVRE